MMRNILTLFFLLFFAVWAGAETKIRLTDPITTIKDLKDEIKKQSGYIIVIPYADNATHVKKLPARVSLPDLLDWICRYYEQYNHIKLSYEYRNKSIFFQKIDQVDEASKNEMLSRKFSLVGKNMSIAKAIKQASERANIKIHLDIADRSAERSDYNYRVSLGEFLEEVRLYYQRYNNIYLAYGVEEKAIRFYKQGKVSQAKLDVSFLPEQVKKSEAPDISPDKSNVIPHKIKKLEIKEAKPKTDLSFEERFKWVKSFDCRDYFIPHKMNDFLIHLTEPQARKGRFKLFFKRISPYFRRLKGFRQFEQHFLALDDYPLSDFQTNQSIEELESMWIQQLLGMLLNEKQKQPHPGKFSYITRAGFATGKGASKVGSLPTHRRNLEDTATWFELGLGIEYESDIKNLWIYEVKVNVDTAQSSNQAGEALEHGSLSFEIEANRQVAFLNLMSVSPYFAWIHEDDLLTKNDIQAHELILSGLRLHWYEKVNVLGFKQGIADSELLLGRLIPRHNERLSLQMREKRDSTQLGLIQHFALINPVDDGYSGPSLRFGYIQRMSKSDFDDGGEAFISAAYLFVRGKWASETSLEFSDWSRKQSVSRSTLLQEFRISPWLKGENFKLALEYEASNSDDALMDYSSTQIKVGFEKKW